ncbi:TonB-dependent receptor [Flammeovirga pectinis]|uniref:TonB-dependent receptor n=1 Tax=Flammeovirga pectinis TaxID=2494373 RepID=A0A3S9NYT8_9BACT|nr:TonB-dependent receptor [Flammeovirga pectinis]AZQ61087.1 TonB-dependent receptor [Flammeovirga pectinis]
MGFNTLTTKEKALKINLDPTIYGSLAEIGAGQEVAANFFKAGAASGTIAKTISAYDMSFSDAIYGPEPGGRYVCQSRVERMLKKEFGLLGERLPTRKDETCFFAFADTIEQLNFNRTNQGHGWLGLRFQTRPNSIPNECVLHVELKDNDPLLQQETIGILGVNLIHACFYQTNNVDEFLSSLMDGLSIHKIIVNFVRVSGPDFLDVDNRLLSLLLVKNGLAKTTMFGPDGQVALPQDFLYKKNILVLRGRFRPITKVNIDMMERSYEHFKNDPDVDENNIVTVSELTLENLRISEDRKKDETDFLDRVDMLCSLGYTVMISKYQEYYRLTNYLSRFTRGKKIGVAVGRYNLEYIFNPDYYQHLKGGILEAFGFLFGRNIKLYVYPSLDRESLNPNELLTSDSINLAESQRALFQSMVDNDKIEDLKDCDPKNLNIISDNVLELIKKGDADWEDMVPQVVVEQIKQYCLFDYPCSVEKKREIEQSRKESTRNRQRRIINSED